MNAEPIEAVIFDCDGTLVDSESLSIRVLVEFVAELGLQMPYQNALREFSGSDLSVVLDKIEAELGHALPTNFLEEFRSRQMSVLRSEVQSVDGAAELLEAMTLPMCIASNAPRAKIDICLQTTGLARFFPDEHIHSAYEIGVWKPNPDLFLKAALALGVRPARCAVVEDSKYGIDAGLAAGMQVFAYDPAAEFRNDSAVRAVCSLRDLFPLLEYRSV